MTYTIIIDKDGEQLVFKGILYFLAEPDRIKMLREKWITVEGFEGLIIHEERTAKRSTAEPEGIATVPQQTAERPLFAVGNVMAWTRYSNALESQIDAMRDLMALLYLGIQEGRDEAFEALDEKTKRLINEVWFERLEEE